MRTVRLLACIGFCAAPPLLAADYTLLATPETVAWGYYSGTAKPEDIPPYTETIYREVKDIGPGGHILTGPVAIAEAEPGDVLEVQILKVDLDVPYSCNGFGPGRGFLPNDFPYSRSKIIPLDRE